MAPTQEEPQIYTTHDANPGDSPARKNRRLILLIGGVIILLLLAALTVAIFKKNTGNSRVASLIPAADVSITGSGFNPATIKIKKGQTVTWTNLDSKPHQVESDPFPTAEKLPELNAETPSEKGGSYSYTFEKSGTYTYHDRLNPLRFQGTVIVE